MATFSTFSLLRQVAKRPTAALVITPISWPLTLEMVLEWKLPSRVTGHSIARPNRACESEEGPDYSDVLVADFEASCGCGADRGGEDERCGERGHRDLGAGCHGYGFLLVRVLMTLRAGGVGLGRTDRHLLGRTGASERVSVVSTGGLNARYK
jgi:hypothetical protein